MAETSSIAWTHYTFNPWIGCTKVSDGCRNCYAEADANHWGRKVWGAKASRQVTTKDYWKKAVKWNRERAEGGDKWRVFCASLSDVFEDHPTANAERPRLWQRIEETPWLDWLLLTKRPERIAANLPADWGAGWPHVWLGTSIEDMRVAARADHLRAIPASVRFVSYEPALGPLDELDLTGIDWMIYGGESGAGFRPHDLAWPRAMRRRCSETGVAFFYKQSPGPRSGMGEELDGEIVMAYPVPRLAHPARVSARAPGDLFAVEQGA